MRIFLTGHQGFLGSLFLPLALAAGHDVVALDSGLFEECGFGEARRASAFRPLRRDLRDVRGEDLAGCEAVVHFAALSNDPLGDLDADLTYAINLEASIRLARAARTAGVRRFLFSSSCSNYGAAGDAILDEQAELRPITAYAVSKVKFEAELMAMASDEFSPVALRNATAYGVTPKLRLDLVLNNLVASGATSGRIVLQSDGTPWRPLVHAEDIARLFLAVLDAPREATHAETINVVAAGENYRVRELAELASEALGGCELAFVSGAGPDPRNYRVSGARLAALLPEFRFRWTAREGARELAAAFRDGGLTSEAFNGPRFKRLAWIRSLLAAGRLDPALRWIAPGGDRSA